MVLKENPSLDDKGLLYLRLGIGLPPQLAHCPALSLTLTW
jgi:hypothetical protein